MVGREIELDPCEVLISEDPDQTIKANLRICTAVSFNVKGTGGALIHVATISPMGNSLMKIKTFSRSLNSGSVHQFPGLSANEMIKAVVLRLRKVHKVKSNQISAHLIMAPKAMPLTPDFLENAIKRAGISDITNHYSVTEVKFNPVSGVLQKKVKSTQQGPFMLPDF
ncbi:MAG: hypothetical protein AABX01_06800 [Candidatus Micrarchaeota archaeon]